MEVCAVFPGTADSTQAEMSWSSDLLMTFSINVQLRTNNTPRNSIINKRLQEQDSKSSQPINPAWSRGMSLNEPRSRLTAASGWLYTPPSQQVLNPSCLARQRTQTQTNTEEWDQVHFGERSRFLPPQPILRMISISLILLFELANQRQVERRVLFALRSPSSCFPSALILDYNLLLVFGSPSISLTVRGWLASLIETRHRGQKSSLAGYFWETGHVFRELAQKFRSRIRWHLRAAWGSPGLVLKRWQLVV